MSEQKQEALTKVEFSVLAAKDADLQQLVRSNLAGRQISALDLDQIRVPTGGGLHWSIPGLFEDEPAKEILGVVIHRTIQRAYWPEKFSGVGNPPDCVSRDSAYGEGDPGGKCYGCPYSQWGTAVNAKNEPAKGQACKQFTRVIVYLPNNFLPSVITLPPTSIMPFERYCNRLTTHGLPLHTVVTGFRLEQAKSGDGITYSRVKPVLLGKLDPEQVAKIVRMAANLTGLFASVEAAEVKPEDIGDEGGDDEQPSR